MKKHFRFILTALSVVICLSFPVQISAQSVPATGSVAGRVSNAGTGNYLQAVEVKDKATGRSVYTDGEGGYEFFNLPVGKRTLVFEYSGLDQQEVTVSVVADGRVTRDVALTSADYDKDMVVLEKFVVAGEREGRAASIAQQKASDVLVDVISSDEFPNVAGGNIGDFLRNLPGISIDYSGADAREISMRGMDASMTAVTVNGMRAANAASGGTNRTFELDQISLQDVESVEIFKTPTAAHDADSGAGIVNMKSKSAFTLKSRRIQFQVGASGNSDRFNLKRNWHVDGRKYSIRPAGSLSYQNSFLRNRLGVTFTANINDFYSSSKDAREQRIRKEDLDRGAVTSDGWGSGDNANTPVIYPYDMRYSYGGGFTRRTSFSLNFDYRLTPYWTLKSTNQVNTSLISSAAQSLRFNSGRFRSDQTAGIDTAQSGIIREGFTPESSTAVTSGAQIRANTIYDGANSLSGVHAMTDSEILQKTGHGTTFGLSAEYKRDKWWINIQGSASQSTNRYGTPNDMPYSQAEFYLRGIDYRIDHPAGSNFPVATQLNGLDVYDLTNYVSRAGTSATTNINGTGVSFYEDGSRVYIPGISIDTHTYPTVRRESGNFAPVILRNSRWNAGKDQFTGGKLDLRRHFTPRGFLSNMYVQGGASYRRQDRKVDQNGRSRWSFNGTTEELQQMLGSIAVTGANDSFGPYATVPYFSYSTLNAYVKANPDLFTEDIVWRAEQEVNGKKESYEKIIGGYAMLNMRFWSRLNLLAGVRWERTTQGGTGPVKDSDTIRDRAMEMMMDYVRGYGYADISSAYADTSVNPLSGMTGREMVNNYTVTNAQALELARISYSQASVEKSFDDLYPNLQLKYTITPNFFVRAAYNESIARQRFDSLLPGYDLTMPNTGGYRIEMNNPDLKPVYFNNYDVALEYYTKSGSFKLGYFYKKTKNYTTNLEGTVEADVLYGGYDFSDYAGSPILRPINAGSARQWGIEASFSQRLTALHRSLRYFSAMGSFTYQKGKTDAVFGDDASYADILARPDSLPVKRLVPKMFMLGLNYSRTPLQASLKYNWKDDYYTGDMLAAGSNVAYKYWKARGTLDASVSYRLFRKYDLYVEVRNLTDEPVILYYHKREWVAQYSRYGAAIYLGVKATL